ncbi:hypothetical protein GGR55DRAFT_41694 [Xylaria sp. FL0064]|nr:hypothetical protein GGR55DRAFT_41694 [Xylaria sp. FL0064]
MKMKFDLEELLAAPSCPASPTLRAAPNFTPAPIRTLSWKKKVTGDLSQKRRRLSALTRRRSMYSPDRREKDAHCRPVHEPYSESPTPSPKRDNHNSFQETSSPQSPPSTPRRPHPRPVPSTPWSTRSAPGRLQLSPTADLITSSKDVDDKIIKVLKRPLSEAQAKRDKVANVYLFEVATADDPNRIIVKIGNTGTTGWERLKQIKAKCKHSWIRREVDPQDVPILLFKKAESLAQAHFVDRKSRFSCVCQTAHGEYFDIDAATAQSAIQFWRAFCESDPYDAKGKLRPFWEHRLQQKESLRYWDNRETNDLGELEHRRLRWEVFANPTQYEKLWFEASHVASKAWPWRKEIIIGLQTVVIGISVSLPLYIFGIWIVILAICLLRE